MLLEAATRLQVLSEGHTVRSAISTMINGGSPFRSSSLAHTMEQPCRHTYSMAQRTRSGLCSLVVLASFLKNGSNRKYKQTTAKFKSEKKRALPGERENDRDRESPRNIHVPFLHLQRQDWQASMGSCDSETNFFESRAHTHKIAEKITIQHDTRRNTIFQPKCDIYFDMYTWRALVCAQNING